MYIQYFCLMEYLYIFFFILNHFPTFTHFVFLNDQFGIIYFDLEFYPTFASLLISIIFSSGFTTKYFSICLLLLSKKFILFIKLWYRNLYLSIYSSVRSNLRVKPSMRYYNYLFFMLLLIFILF